MTNIRLLPLLLVAISSLFLLKTAGLWLNSAFLFGGVAPVQAQTVNTDGKAEQNASSAAPDQAPAEDGNSQQPANSDSAAPPLQPPPNEVGRLVIPGTHGPADTRVAVLERLRERREQLDTIERELTMRENLIAAAEQQLDVRIKELKEIEARIETKIGEREEKQQAQLKGLVTMYETMKPKDAARIFNRLELPILIEVVSQMSARKMAVILAAMSSEAAERLTVEIATRGNQNYEQADQMNLPKIGEGNPG